MNLEVEIGMCRGIKRKRGYCYWGVCKFCGVPQVLKKLRTGKLEHNRKKLDGFRKVAEGLE